MQRTFGLSVGFLGWASLAMLVTLHTPSHPALLLLFTVCASLAEYWPVKLRAGTLSILTAFIIPAVVLTGTVGAAIMLAGASVVAAVTHRRPMFFGLFNGGQFIISALLAQLAVSSWTHLQGGLFHEVGWLAAYYGVFLLVNHLIVDTYFLASGYSWRSVVWDGLALDIAQSLVTVPLGIAMVYAYDVVGWPGILGVALPVITFGYALRLQTDLSQRNRTLETLYSMQESFARAHGVGEILAELSIRIAASLRARERYAAAVVDRGECVPVSGSTFAPPEDLLRSACQERRRHFLEGASQTGALQPGARSGAVVPVQSADRIFGVLAFTWTEQSTLADQDEHLLDAALRIAALACEKEELLRETERLAATDPRLPGLYNHRYFMAQLEAEIGRLGRESEVLSLLYIDLDGFKTCNDRYGHLAGDEALREFAAILRSHTRPRDVAARYAGDEFVLLLPDTDEELAESVAHRLRAEVEMHPFLRAESDTEVHLSFSYGTATTRLRETLAQALLSQADQAMYRDKDHGRRGLRKAPQHGEQ